MVISHAEQEHNDYDWYGVDEHDHIGHFTTAGFKYLPSSVSKSAEDLTHVTDYFENKTRVRCDHTVDTNLGNRIDGWKGEAEEGKYLSSFTLMADRGLYSFDIETHVRPGISYFRVAIPATPLCLRDLPANIQAIVEQTRLRGIAFQDSSTIDYELTLSS